jgi:hypothetical protein
MFLKLVRQGASNTPDSDRRENAVASQTWPACEASYQRKSAQPINVSIAFGVASGAAVM